MRAFLSIILLALLLSSCMPPRVTPEKLHAHYKAHAMEKLNHMSYMGTKGEYHYFQHFRISMMKREYRVRKDDLYIKDPFPLTEDRKQWRPYMVAEVDSHVTGVVLIPYRDIPLNLEASPVTGEVLTIDGPVIEGVMPIQP